MVERTSTVKSAWSVFYSELEADVLPHQWGDNKGCKRNIHNVSLLWLFIL